LRSFECLITDDRTSVPELRWLVVGDAERAKALARRGLLQDAHYQAVELRENGALLFRVTREELTPALATAPAERRSFGGFRLGRHDSR
jgi:hypothetical protein